jgi:exopolyphosphatase/guanosine-5'-triphosphate,3'-diphosphate pyrophosphatase
VTGAGDRERVARLLGRSPRDPFAVVVRDAGGGPLVIRNGPILDDGTPMPTRYWLVGQTERAAVDRLEAAGGVRAAERAVDPERLAAAHAAYAQERDAAIPPGWDGPRPSGGVGGTRKGVKCLHAHYAWHLAGGDDPVGRWVACRLQPVAAIDCGTNSTRLLLAGPGGEPLVRLMQITRLGRDVDRTRRLAPDAVQRTLAVLAEYRSAMDQCEVGRVRMTATSAARDAANRDDFFRAAADIVGVRPELLAGEEEGRLSFLGATAGLAPDSGPWLVADIGGGSTELITGAEAGGLPEAVRSLDVGCVRLTERFFTSDPPAPEQIAEASGYVADLLATISGTEKRFDQAETLVGLAGTVAALAGIAQGLESYDRARVHHYRLSRDTVDGLLATLASESISDRRRRPGVEPDRADVIVGGTVVLAELMRHFEFETCLTSESDILDGLIATLLSA